MSTAQGRPRPNLQRSVQVAILVAVSLAAGSIGVGQPSHVRARTAPAPVQVGVSFSPRRAESLGLDYQAAFTQLLSMHFRVVRLSAYWDDSSDPDGTEKLDWMVGAAERAGQPLVLTVGMKAMGWPEFYIPPGLTPPAGVLDGQDISGDPVLRSAAIGFVEDSVSRYRHSPSVVAWQVENEPFNRAGPQRWWLGRDFVALELAVVRRLDRRPVIVNAFSHFNRALDAASSRHGFDVRSFLGFEVDTAEQTSLAAIGPGDILGLDVYTRIGYRDLFGHVRVSQANPDWDDHAARWRAAAHRQGKQAWITESQAEPWEADYRTQMQPLSFAPNDLLKTFQGLKEAGYTTVLLWGAEYWLARSAAGDGRWLDAAAGVLAAEARAPALI